MSLRVDNTNPLYTSLVVNGVQVMKINQDGSVELPNNPGGSGSTRVVTNLSLSTLAFTKEFISAEQTITPAGLLTIPHNLGSVPKLVTRTLVCKVPELGYSVGDTIDVSGANVSSGTSYGVVIIPDATNLVCRYAGSAAVFFALSKINGGASSITPANWRLIVRAYA